MKIENAASKVGLIMLKELIFITSEDFDKNTNRVSIFAPIHLVTTCKRYSYTTRLYLKIILGWIFKMWSPYVLDNA